MTDITSTVVVEMQSSNGQSTHVSIPIPSKHDKLKKNVMKSMENAQIQKKEELENKQILYSTKRGYSVLLLIIVLLLAVLTLYVVQTDSFAYYLFNGITGCCISLILMIPTFLLYRFVETKVIKQHNTINKKIIQTFSLKQQIEAKNLDILQKKVDIDNYIMMIAEQQQTINKLSSRSDRETDPARSNAHKFHLIQGFRRGHIEIQMECADVHELVAMFNVVVACITLLPFGQTNYRKRITAILERKIEQHKYLQMHFYFFLLSYLECVDVKRLFRRHRIMKKVKSIADFYNYENPRNHLLLDDAATMFSDDGTVASAPFTPYSPDADDRVLMPNNDGFPGLYGTHEHNDEKKVNTIHFSGTDPIKLFRAPIDNKAQPGLIIAVPSDLQNRFFDPINGNKFLQQLVVRAIFHSKTKPYLIDCYVKDKQIQKKHKKRRNGNDDPYGAQQYEGMMLSSTFILKKGDDLRKDQAILQMMSFMNEIWRENGLKYQDGIHFVECLIYKCIPMGNDVGIIEMVGDCIELENVLDLKQDFIGNITERDVRIAHNKYNRLVTTAAAAYIASFVCGVRDRHHDNVLIETSTFTLFHIDFGYIFNDSTTLDTAKFAITSDLKKLMNSYKNGWEDFIDTAVKAWIILRQNSVELIDFARVAFAFLYKSNDIEEFMRESLKLELNQESAVKYIWSQLSKAPSQWKTKMKNLAHTFAQKVKHKKKKRTAMRSTPQSRAQSTASDDFPDINVQDILAGKVRVQLPDPNVPRTRTPKQGNKMFLQRLPPPEYPKSDQHLIERMKTF